MALWGSTDTTANKPKYDNGSDVFGITAGEVGATTGDNVVAISLTSGGTGYANSGALVITGSNSTPATGTFTASGGVIQTVTLTAGGAGYSAAPTVDGDAGGGGSDLAGTINVTAGSITSVTITNGGSGYTSAPTVTAPTGSGAVFTVEMGEGASTIGHTGWAKRTVGTGGRAGRVFWEVLVAGGMADGAGDEDVATPDS